MPARLPSVNYTCNLCSWSSPQVPGDEQGYQKLMQSFAEHHAEDHGGTDPDCYSVSVTIHGPMCEHEPVAARKGNGSVPRRG